jgi:F1F0 ATPase subunit 2
MVLFLAAGCGLGLIFFGGLWLTVRALPAARYPTTLAIASFWGRTGLAVITFIAAFSWDWKGALICLAGFLLVRVFLGVRTPHRSATKRTME